ncbi:hypothetical protein EYF80_027357 [Liparis tanakae]|uniref:Uncharacterized protein n=1 Tax=Liparis tanakae TaxID=230148 RepID=A0A4Z2H9E4_9TELE|nr:hypothetical protein EYF80_027357 [Liparis tanakae]
MRNTYYLNVSLAWAPNPEVENQSIKEYTLFISNMPLCLTDKEEERVHFHLAVSPHASLSATLAPTPRIVFGSPEKGGECEREKWKRMGCHRSTDDGGSEAHGARELRDGNRHRNDGPRGPSILQRWSTGLQPALRVTFSVLAAEGAANTTELFIAASSELFSSTTREQTSPMWRKLDILSDMAHLGRLHLQKIDTEKGF